MPDVITASGSCLCGATRITAKTLNTHIGACHCGMCRKWGGGPLLAADCGTDVLLDGEENVSVFDSSDWAERGFCSKCGSHLFYRLKHNKEYVVPVGIFDTDDALVFDQQIFIDKKPSLYRFANETKDMTEAEVFEKYGA